MQAVGSQTAGVVELESRFVVERDKDVCLVERSEGDIEVAAVIVLGRPKVAFDLHNIHLAHQLHLPDCRAKSMIRRHYLDVLVAVVAFHLVNYPSGSSNSLSLFDLWA